MSTDDDDFEADRRAACDGQCGDPECADFQAVNTPLLYALIQLLRRPRLATPADRDRCGAIVGEPMCRHQLPAATCGYCKGTE